MAANYKKPWLWRVLFSDHHVLLCPMDKGVRRVEIWPRLRPLDGPCAWLQRCPDYHKRMCWSLMSAEWHESSSMFSSCIALISWNCFIIFCHLELDVVVNVSWCFYAWFLATASILVPMLKDLFCSAPVGSRGPSAMKVTRSLYDVGGE